MKLKLRSYPVSVFLLGLALIGIFTMALRPTLVVTEVRLDHLPMTIGSLTGTKLRFDVSVYTVLNADGNVLRNYRSQDGRVINLYIGYYGTAKGGRAKSAPQYCYTGQGWSIERWDKVSIDPPGTGKVQINRMIVKKRAERQLVYFWHQSEATVMRTGWEQNLYKFKHRLLYNRNDGAFVRVSMTLPEGKREETEQRAREFSRAVVPLLSQFWPVEEPAKL